MGKVMATAIQGGRSAVKLLKEIFHIDTAMPVRSLTLHASVEDVVTIDIECFANLRDVDIHTDALSKQTVVDGKTFVVSISEVE